MNNNYLILGLVLIVVSAILVKYLAQKGVPITVRTPLVSLEFNPSEKLIKS